MTSRKSERISKRQSHPEDNIGVISSGPKAGNEKELEQVPVPTRPKLPARKGRGGGGGGRVARARGSGRRRGQPNQPTGRTTINIIDANEVEGNRNRDCSTEMNADDLKVALDTTREEFGSYMQSVTGVLCTLFSVLTATQINDIENSTNETLRKDNLFINCINQAKSSAAVRDLSLKLGSARNNPNEEKRNSPSNISTVAPQSIAHHNKSRGAGATPNVKTNAQAPKIPAQSGGNQSNDGRINNTETPTTTQTTSTDQPEWLRKLDENRKYNVILFGIHDINNTGEDHRIVEEVLWTIGCQHNC